MDDATFDKEVEFIRRAYTRYRDDLPKFVATSYDSITDGVERVGVLDHFIKGSEMRKDYWDAVNLIARRQLRKGNALPPALANWIKDVLADQYIRKQAEKARPRPAKGPRTPGRDQSVRLAVENLITRGFKATRRLREMPRACAEGGSACDVVGAAFNQDYKNTERIWQARKRIVGVLE